MSPLTAGHHDRHRDPVGRPIAARPAGVCHYAADRPDRATVTIPAAELAPPGRLSQN